MRMPATYLVLIAVAAAGLALGGPAHAAPASRPAPKIEPPSKAEQLFADGRDALYRGDYAKAIGLLEKAIAEDATKTSYRVHLARAHQYLGRHARAEEILAAVLKANPDHVEAGQILGEMYARQENHKSVVALLEPLLKYRHDYPTYHLLAEAKYSLGDYENARKYFEQAIKLNPQSAADHYQLGNIYLAGNFFAMAAEAYQKALSLGLKSPVLHYKLGSAYFNLRNYFGRITTATLKGGEPGTINGAWYIIEPVPGRKDTFRVAPADSAIYQIAQAISEGIGDQPDIQLLRANIYLNAGRFQQARAMYKQIEKSIPKDDQALFYYYYAQSAFGTGDYEEYLALLGKAIALNKSAYQATLVDAYQKVADQYNQAGRLDKYIEYLQKAVAESPQTASIHLKLGYALEEEGKFPEAVMQWKMVLDLESDHPKRLDLLNLIGKYSRATTQPAATQRAPRTAG